MKKRSRKCLRKMASFLIIASFLAQMCLAKNVLADSDRTYTYKGDGYEITYNVENSWDNGYKADISVKNTGDTDIHNWSVGLKLDGEINNIWNAKIENLNQVGNYTVSGIIQNQNINPGESVEFGMIVNSCKVQKPEVFFSQSKEAVANTEDYKVDYNVSNDWSKGLQANFALIISLINVSKIGVLNLIGKTKLTTYGMLKLLAIKKTIM